MVDCIIQARTGSTRFPKKIIKKIDDDLTVLEFLIKQLKNCKEIRRIIVATTKLDEDDTIIEICKKLKILYFRGDALNLLDRYYKCAKQFKSKEIIRVTSDCPLIDPNLVDEGINEFHNGGYDYLTNSHGNFPHGVDFSIFKYVVLEDSWNNAQLPSEKEHVIPYMEKNQTKFNICNIKNNNDFSKVRITLDWPDDLDLLKMIIVEINNRPILMKDVMNVLDNNLEMLKINQDHERDEGYLKSLENDEEFRKKEVNNE